MNYTDPTGLATPGSLDWVELIGAFFALLGLSTIMFYGAFLACTATAAAGCIVTVAMAVPVGIATPWATW